MNNAFLAGKKLLGGNYSQYTPSGKGLLAQQGRAGKVPHFGDKVYFYSPKLKRVSHVGIVVSVSKSGDRYDIETVEGNTSSISFDRNGGCVTRKRYSFTLSEVGGTNRINCFCTPFFSDSTCTVEELIRVANNELGYEEKANNAGLEGKHTNVGRNNYTKYGAWYKEACGGDHPAYWCEQFVSWCAWQACKLHKESQKTGWESVDGKWVYKLNGELVKDSWHQIGGRWYVFDGSGYMIKGWFKQDTDWYYMNPVDGAMLSEQWVDVDGKSYYLTQSGLMARGGYIEDASEKLYFYVDENGVYKKELDTNAPDLSKYEVMR